jgi:hypothetical protein
MCVSWRNILPSSGIKLDRYFNEILQMYSAMRNTADVTGAKPFAV